MTELTETVVDLVMVEPARPVGAAVAPDEAPTTVIPRIATAVAAVSHARLLPDWVSAAFVYLLWAVVVGVGMFLTYALLMILILDY